MRTVHHDGIMCLPEWLGIPDSPPVVCMSVDDVQKVPYPYGALSKWSFVDCQVVVIHGAVDVIG